MSFFFSREYLNGLLKKDGPESYAGRVPFPHAQFESFLPEAYLKSIISAFDSAVGAEWKQFDNPNEKKFSSNNMSTMPPALRHLLNEFNGAVFVDFLEELTGIVGLIPDPHFIGGGLHLIKRDGKLGIHADFNRHSKLKLDRRLNVILYLNEDWSEEYGGHLELWARDGKACVKKILPVANRLVVFSTTSDSFHGHPAPLTCPADRARKSLALYYYSCGRPAEERRRTHSTLFIDEKTNLFSSMRERIRQMIRASRRKLKV